MKISKTSLANYEKIIDKDMSTTGISETLLYKLFKFAAHMFLTQVDIFDNRWFYVSSEYSFVGTKW